MKAYCTILLLFFTATCTTLKAQDTLKIKQAASMMSEAFHKGDYATLIKYTYPKAVAMGGGKEKMISTIKKSIAEMKADGVTFHSISLGKVGKIYKAGTELHCVIPQTQYMNVTGGTISSISPLMGISQDQGKTWTFIAAGNMTPEKIHMLFPKFNKDLMLEKATKPVFHPE